MGNFENNRSGGRSRDRDGGNRGGGYGGGSRDRNGGNRGGGYGGGNRGGGFNRNSGPREMHDVICDKCKSQCQVPFKPSTDKPVLCKECFSKDNGSDRGGSRDNKVAQSGVSQEQFNQLNTKLDKILSVLQELEIAEEYDDEEEEEEEIEEEESKEKSIKKEKEK
jgi:CxxC-x17-CxxC domain-containing protein